MLAHSLARLGYRDTFKFITKGPKPTCMIIHPTLDTKVWQKVVWEAEEAMELVKASKWDILPGPNEPRLGWDEASLRQIDERNNDLLAPPEHSQSGWLTIKSEEEESDDEMDLDDPLWLTESVRRQFAESCIVRLHGIKPDWYFAEGKVDEICVSIGKAIHPPKYVFINAQLTPTQTDNLETVFNQALRAWQGNRIRERKETSRLKQRVGYIPEDEQEAYADRTDNFIPDFIQVLDRPRMILELFATRADSGVPRLQVEIARRLWLKRNINSANFSKMKRQLDVLQKHVAPYAEVITYKGNVSIDATQGNPAQSNREIFMEQLAKDILKMKARLKVVREEREKARQARTGIVTVALIGYTNVGKTAIMNHLTNESFRSRDIVFQTIETKFRHLRLPSGANCVLVDSIGFIQDLPHFLFDAFHSTLEEILAANLILHIRDISHPFAVEQKLAVEDALMRAGMTRDDLESRVMEVWNKIDKIPDFKEDGLLAVSAMERRGFDSLLQAIDERCAKLQRSKKRLVTVSRESAGSIFKFLRSNSLAFFDETLTVSEDGETLQIQVLLDPNQTQKILKKFPGILNP